MSRIVLDSSAVLAMILEEPGGVRVDELLDECGRGAELEILISSVNWCEVLTRMERAHQAIAGGDLLAALAGVEIVPFGKFEAEHAARLSTIDLSLSLGDRACLALATARNAAAWTADRAWAQMNLGVRLEMLR